MKMRQVIYISAPYVKDLVVCHFVRYLDHLSLYGHIGVDFNDYPDLYPRGDPGASVDNVSSCRKRRQKWGRRCIAKVADTALSH